MSNSLPHDISDFLAFANAHVQSGDVEISPEALLAQWRATQRNQKYGQRSALEVLDEAGFIGCIETGVGDLSTNKAHMEGFGRN